MPTSFGHSLTLSLFYILLVPKAAIISYPNYISKLVQSCKCALQDIIN